MPTDHPEIEPKIGGNMPDDDMNGEAHNPTGQHTHRNLTKAPMEGGFAFSDNGHSRTTSNDSNKTFTILEPPNHAPPQSIRVAQFSKNELSPRLVWKQTIDVKADNHWGDMKLNHVPDFRVDWGEKGFSNRKAFYVHVGPLDFPEVRTLHGWYVVFTNWDRGYATNKHRMMQGIGRHVHEDFFIAKIGLYPDCNKWTAYIDMPDEFLSARTEAGWNVYEAPLAEMKNSMIGAILA